MAIAPNDAAVHVAAAVRSLFFLGFGVLAGVVGTVLFFTLDPTFDGDERETAGGGNARISLDEEAVAALIQRELSGLPQFKDGVAVTVDIMETNLMKVELTIGVARIGLKTSVLLDPNIVDDKLKMDVVEASSGQVVVPDELAKLVERPLQRRLDDMAEGFAYRLTSIATTEARITLEIEI